MQSFQYIHLFQFYFCFLHICPSTIYLYCMTKIAYVSCEISGIRNKEKLMFLCILLSIEFLLFVRKRKQKGNWKMHWSKMWFLFFISPPSPAFVSKGNLKETRHLSDTSSSVTSFSCLVLLCNADNFHRHRKTRNSIGI